ncbi:cytosolic sulfotransferase 14-like [Mangifera indica]|uniref:cytosolic sulfotransferase 14-like n=1 Tax=Mangifera indica TaxID=29780 RepID=UPI001CFA9365|nr:cytosolic sulfotransferase 14-like [Mangifera indica]
MGKKLPLKLEEGKWSMGTPEKRLRDDECFPAVVECSCFGATQGVDKACFLHLSCSSRSLDIEDNIKLPSNFIIVTVMEYVSRVAEEKLKVEVQCFRANEEALEVEFACFKQPVGKGGQNGELINRLLVVEAEVNDKVGHLVHNVFFAIEHWFPDCDFTFLERNYTEQNEQIVAPLSTVLAFTIVNRTRFPLQNSPLLTTTPHQLVPFLELDLYWKNQSPNLEDNPKPRILATHLPYASLPNSILNSGCRIVYVARNPLDQFISRWKFLSSWQEQNMNLVSIEEAFEKTCNGVQFYGPVWEHVLGYWKASQENPEKVLFLKYEDMQENIISNFKNLANFLGCAFSQVEETQGVIKEISKICSFDNLKNLEVNKNGKFLLRFGNEAFFRKGTVGDWRNYLTSSMSDRMEKILEEKLCGSGLSFKK